MGSSVKMAVFTRIEPRQQGVFSRTDEVVLPSVLFGTPGLSIVSPLTSLVSETAERLIGRPSFPTSPVLFWLLPQLRDEALMSPGSLAHHHRLLPAADWPLKIESQRQLQRKSMSGG